MKFPLVRPRPGSHRGRVAARRAAACLLLVSPLLAGCDTRDASVGALARPGGAPRVVSVLDLPPERMRVAVADAYRLSPDRRLLAAVADLHVLLTSQDRQAVAAEFRDGRWHVRYRDAEVGTLPELPDFPDFLALLSGWADRLAGTPPAAAAPPGSDSGVTSDAEREIERFLAPHLIAALDRLGPTWATGRRDPPLLRAAARALVLLTLQTLDLVEMADAIPARAAALLVLARRLGAEPMAREEALLARVAGYDAHAARVVAALPPDDPVRLYVARDDARLGTVARQPTAGVAARYLWLLRLAEERDVAAWSAWREAHFQHEGARLPALRAGLLLNRFGTNEELSRELEQAVLQEVADRGARALADEPFSRRLLRGARRVLTVVRAVAERLVRERLGRREPASSVPPPAAEMFEAALEEVAGVRVGPVWDADAVRAYYRGHYYSALYVYGLHELDWRSSVGDAHELARLLAKPAGGPAADFARWYRDLADFKAARHDARRLIEDLQELAALGARPLERTFEELQKQVAPGVPSLFVGARRLVARMDTRVAHRVYLGHLAHTVLLDLRLAERLYASIVDAAPHWYPFVQAWHLEFTGQQQRLDALLGSAAWPVETRVEVLRRLEERLDPARLRAEYRRLLDEAPDDWRLRSRYVDYLERTRQYDEARAVVTAWLERHDESAEFDYIFARTALARMYYLSGRYQEGWTAVEAVVGSNQAGAVGRAALLLEQLGRREEAEKLGLTLVGTYPDSIWGRGVLAELYWRRGRHEDAARVLTGFPRKIHATDWRATLGPPFAAVFARRPAKEALAAFAALLTGGVSPFELRELAAAIAGAGNRELAFQLAATLRGAGLSDLVFRIGAYRHLKASKGNEAALAWLRAAVPPALLGPSAMVAFDEEEFDLLWELSAHPQGDEDGHFTWLMRAAAWVGSGSPDDARRRALADHYRAPGPGHYHALGRFLLGLETEPAVLALATSPKRRCEIAYYVGLRARGEGRHADASDWFRVAVETGQDRNGEYAWAYRVLLGWERQGKSLARLAEDATGRGGVVTRRVPP